MIWAGDNLDRGSALLAMRIYLTSACFSVVRIHAGQQLAGCFPNLEKGHKLFLSPSRLRYHPDFFLESIEKNPLWPHIRPIHKFSHNHSYRKTYDTKKSLKRAVNRSWAIWDWLLTAVLIDRPPEGQKKYQDKLTLPWCVYLCGFPGFPIFLVYPVGQHSLVNFLWHLVLV